MPTIYLSPAAYILQSESSWKSHRSNAELIRKNERWLERPGYAGKVWASSPHVPDYLVPAVYILQSESCGKFYIGAALSLPDRLSEHHRGHSPYTHARGPWQLVYHEDFATLAEARQRERQIKSWKSHRSIAELIASKKVG